MHNTLPASVDFSDVSLTIIDHDGIPYLTAADLARALGYKDASAVLRIYSRHTDEFTSEMSLTVNLTVKGFGCGNSEKPVRLFSPRGCHLVAMFARTSVAAAFRRWVLDVLEVLPSIRKTGSYSATGTLVNENVLYAIWFLCFHFKKLHEMSHVNKVPQALAWLGAKQISGELYDRLLDGLHGGVGPIEKALGPHLEQAAQKVMGNASRHL
ncbi:phage antirepressor protein [Xylella fastidiosa]|nr:Bro-N domain-containing protein [Xylella fastidiosa]ALQ94942.1 phage antirepressor protein [Xylella fastidiosa]